MVLITAGNYMFKVNNRNTRTRCEIEYLNRLGVNDVLFCNSEILSL